MATKTEITPAGNKDFTSGGPIPFRSSRDRLCKFGALFPPAGGFIAGKKFSAPKSASSPRRKPYHQINDEGFIK